MAKKILIADDQRKLVEAMKIRFEKDGYEVVDCLGLIEGRKKMVTVKASRLRTPMARKAASIPRCSDSTPPINGPKPNPLKKAALA